MQTINVRTTQNVFIQYPIASLGDRILAYLIDFLIMIAYIILCAVMFGFAEISSPALIIGTISVPFILYHLLFEIFMDGQSPGKRQMDIKVVRIDGTPATIGNYVIRWLLRFIDINLFSGAIAMIVIAAGGKGQRLGDLAAGTTVVKLVAQRQVTANEVFTLVEDNYVPTFSQVIQLTDQDIEVIQQALAVNRDSGNDAPVLVLTQKIKSMLGIQTDMPPVKFLYTVVKDYTHLSAGK